MGKISRKNVDYFEMFEQGIAISLEIAKTLREALDSSPVDKAALRQVKEVEHKGDLLVHECLMQIDVAFITPIDRTDLVEIIKSVENITDSVDVVATHLRILGITEVNEYIRKFSDFIVQCCEELHKLMLLVKQFKKNPVEINDSVTEVNRIEEEADALYAECMSNLFTGRQDPVDIIKKMELYKLLEASVDCCEDVADLVQKVIVAKT